tara:strand:- start:112 stop:705 length:594 start_codon:yes stop_codon:yes gene_type:complete
LGLVNIDGLQVLVISTVILILPNFGITFEENSGKNNIKIMETNPKYKNDLGPKKYIITDEQKVINKAIFAELFGPNITIVDTKIMTLKASILLPLLRYIAAVKGIIISNMIIPLPKFALLLVGSSPANNAKFDLISAFKIISSKMQKDVRIKGIPIKFSKLVILLLDVTFKAMNIAMIIPKIGQITSEVLSGLIDQK